MLPKLILLFLRKIPINFPINHFSTSHLDAKTGCHHLTAMSVWLAWRQF